MNNYTRINNDKSIALYFSVLTCIAKDTETLNVGGSRVSSARTLRPSLKLIYVVLEPQIKTVLCP